MRQITRDVCNAFQYRQSFKSGNTRTDGRSMWLHGNKIAEWRDDGLWISNAGWSSNTTKERLNGLSGVSVQQRNFTWFLNGVEWSGEWINVHTMSAQIERAVEVIQEAVEQFDVTSEWLTKERYSRPIYSVFHALSKSDLVEVESKLSAEGIKSRRMESDTDGEYKPNYFVVVRAEDYEKSLTIIK
jgi:hypothetical protein